MINSSKLDIINNIIEYLPKEDERLFVSALRIKSLNVDTKILNLRIKFVDWKQFNENKSEILLKNPSIQDVNIYIPRQTYATFTKLFSYNFNPPSIESLKTIKSHIENLTINTNSFELSNLSKTFPISISFYDDNRLWSSNQIDPIIEEITKNKLVNKKLEIIYYDSNKEIAGAKIWMKQKDGETDDDFKKRGTNFVKKYTTKDDVQILSHSSKKLNGGLLYVIWGG